MKPIYEPKGKLSDERDREKSLLISYENAKRVIVACQ